MAINRDCTIDHVGQVFPTQRFGPETAVHPVGPQEKAII
jgi:hypothetical protein